MPLDNFANAQKQSRMFQDELSKELNPKNKLYKLRSLINWDSLEKEVLKLVKIHQLGRNKRSVRILLGVTMLQAMYNFSDCLTAESFEENVYWKYFCGYEYVDSSESISQSAIRRFRQLLGEEGYNIILQELVRVGERVGSYKKKDLGSVIIDTTVQSKNIKHPHDAYLLGKARGELVKLGHKLGFKFNDTYEKKYKREIIKLWKYRDGSKSKKRIKVMKHLKVLVGRVIRCFDRKLAISSIILPRQEQEFVTRIKSIHAQSFLSKKAKEEYKKAGNKVIYSFHAKEVECIGKGKLNKPYEFGNKVGIAVSGHGNFVLGVKSFHGNPYDGHTLAQTVEQTEQVTKQEMKQIFVDLGYRGNNYKKKSTIYTPYTKKAITPRIKAMQKRRSAIEPVIGHLKQFGRMSRNYLKGMIGDILNPLISVIGYNLRNIANKIITLT